MNTELREFSKNLHLVVLPSTLWAVHVDPEYEFIAVLYVQVKSLSKISIDKGIIVTSSNTHNLIDTTFLIQNEIVHIPTVNNYVKAISDLSHLIYIIHNLKMCSNADNKIEYPHCNKYIELEKFDAFCSSCKDKSILWKDLNYIQDLQYGNSESSDEIIADNIMDENNVGYIKTDNVLPLVSGSFEFVNSSVENAETKVDYKHTITKKDNYTNSVSENHDIRQQKRDRYAFPCEHCTKKFRTNQLLEEHVRSHTGEKPYVCTICNKANSRRSAHQRHMLIHSNVKPNLCNVCGKTFCHGYRMADHLLTHSSERPFECETCHKTFAKSYNLKIHQRIHTGAHSFVCSTCGKTYTTQSNLATHIKSTHTHRKPHSCSSCHMTFVHPRYLRIHMRKHTGEKPYKCKMCDKAFAKNIHLTIHTRTHTGEKPHLCTVCGKGFTTTGNLSAHERVHHKDLIDAGKI